MQEKTQQDLLAIYNTLNLVEVKGEANISHMYGVMSVLKQVINNLQNQEIEKQEQ